MDFGMLEKKSYRKDIQLCDKHVPCVTTSPGMMVQYSLTFVLHY